MPVPKGYTIDQPDQQGAVNVPQGYTLDQPGNAPQSAGASATAAPAPDATLSGSVGPILRDLGVGAAKGLTQSFTAIPAAIGNTLNDALGYQKPQRVTDQENYLQPANTAQAIGKYGEQAAEIALPLVGGGVKAANALNFSAKKQAAGDLLQSVASDANKVPVELENSSDAALKLMDWQKKTQLGPTINKFLNRITSPTAGPLTYEDARDYYQLLGKLSSEETSKLAPTIQRTLSEMVAGLRTDIGNAADTVGRAADYYKGLGQYAKASKYQGWYDSATDFLAKEGVKAAANGAGVGIGGTAAYKLWQYFTGK